MQCKMSPTAATQAQITSLVIRVGQFMLLATKHPQSRPFQKNKLSGQSFFVYAENGDQVLMYQKAKKAIPYRPSTNKSIEVGSVNIQAASKQTTAVSGVSINSANSGKANFSADLSLTPTQITVSLYSETSTPGLTRKAEP